MSEAVLDFKIQYAGRRAFDGLGIYDIKALKGSGNMTYFLMGNEGII